MKQIEPAWVDVPGISGAMVVSWRSSLLFECAHHDGQVLLTEALIDGQLPFACWAGKVANLFHHAQFVCSPENHRLARLIANALLSGTRVSRALKLNRCSTTRASIAGERSQPLPAPAAS